MPFFPNPQTPILEGNKFNKKWYMALLALFQRHNSQTTQGGEITPVTAGASPYAYTATENGSMAIYGGTITAITLKRGSTTIDINASASMVQVDTNDVLTVTYSAVPTMNWVPR